ncbi:TonB-dependent receptor [Pseudomonas sp. ODNR1LW]|nr:TonB-dependent receptor [Pseudomonas sp. ODNR1LW]
MTLWSVEAKAAPSPGEVRRFEVSAGPLGQALRDLSRQAGVAVIADADLVRGRTARDVTGRRTAAEALAALLAGNPDLTSRRVGDALIVERVRPVTAGSSPPSAELEEVVVLGRPGALLEALEIKRDYDGVSDVVSADDQGLLPTSNIAESLARLPGVNAVRNHQTGEGDRLTVRGMATEWNAYRINGVRLGGAGSRADKFYRGVRLSYLPPEGIQSLIVRKTLTPDLDGDALGGLIDIQTPTAFDSADDSVRLSAETGWLTRFDHPGSQKLALAVSHRFSDRLGLFLAANWSDARSKFEMVGGDSDDLPDVWYDTTYSTGWDFDSFVMRGMELAVGETRVRRLGLNGSLDWRGAQQDLHLRVQYNRYDGEEYRNRLNLRNDGLAGSERLVQIDSSQTGLAQPDEMVIGSDPELGRIYGYTTEQVKDADGDGRITDADRTARSLYSLAGASGVWDPMGFRLRRFWEATEESGLLSSITLGGRRWGGPWVLDYDVSLSRSQDDLDNGATLEFRTDVVEWLGNRGVDVIETGDPRFRLWDLNDAGMKAVQDPAVYGFRSLGSDWERTSETLAQAQFDLSYRVGSNVLEEIRLGARYMRSDRHSAAGARPDLIGPETMADLAGLFGAPVTDLFDGRYVGEHQLGVVLDSRRVLAEIERAYRGESAYFVIDPEFEADEDPENFRLMEEVTAGYVMATARWADTEFTGGVRVEHTRTRVGFPVLDAIRGDGRAQRRNSFANILPSIHLKRALAGNAVLRAAVWTSFARPDIARMTTARQYVYDQDPDDDGDANPKADWVLLEVREGNPDLKPMEAVGYDLSLEQYGRSTAWSAAAFHKEIRNFLYRASTSSIRDGGLTDRGDEDGVPVRAYVNGRWARISGVELAVRHDFDWAPAPLDGLGVTANLTWQVSRADANISWRLGDVLPFTETPETLASVELFWQGAGWEAAVGWSRQGGFLEGMDSFANDPYEQPYSFVDLSLRKRLGDDGLASIQIRNLLNSHTYWYTFGAGAENLREYIRTGPSVTLSISRSF